MPSREKQLNAVWATIQREYGLTFSPLLRKELELRYRGRDTELEDMEADLRAYAELKKLDLQSAPMSVRKQIKQKKHPRPPEKRLHLVHFVIERTMAVGLGDKPVIWNILGRIKWKEISKAWNEVHPYDPTTPLSLKSRFHHAIIDPDVTREIVVRKASMSDLEMGNLGGDIRVEWTGRIDEKESVTIQVPDVRRLRVKQPKIQDV